MKRLQYPALHQNRTHGAQIVRVSDEETASAAHIYQRNALCRRKYRRSATCDVISGAGSELGCGVALLCSGGNMDTALYGGILSGKV